MTTLTRRFQTLDKSTSAKKFLSAAVVLVTVVAAGCGSADDPSETNTSDSAATPATLSEPTPTAPEVEPTPTAPEVEPSEPRPTPADGGDDVGMTETPEDAEAQTRSLFRADVAVEASLSDGLLAISVFGVDAPRLVAPAVDVTLNDFTVDELPSECTVTDTGFVCELAGSLGSATGSGPPTEAIEWTITLAPLPGASVSSVDIVATSNENPLDNDPDPTNNTTTLTTAG